MAVTAHISTLTANTKLICVLMGMRYGMKDCLAFRPAIIIQCSLSFSEYLSRLRSFCLCVYFACKFTRQMRNENRTCSCFRMHLLFPINLFNCWWSNQQLTSTADWSYIQNTTFIWCNDIMKSIFIIIIYRALAESFSSRQFSTDR